MKNRPLIIALVTLTVICLFTLLCIGVAGGITTIALRIANQAQISRIFETATPTPTPVVIRPSTPTPFESENRTTDEQGGSFDSSRIIETPVSTPTDTNTLTNTLQSLQDTYVPMVDRIDIAQRLEGKQVASGTVIDPEAPYSKGAAKTFWVLDTDTNKAFQVEATLQYVTDHAYFWFDDRINFDSDELEKLGNTFENKIYPTNREFFGSEWSPGVDGDPHLYVLFASGLGNSVAGLFSPSDEYPPLVSEYSNAHEMFLMNSDTTDLDDEFTYGVLAHEFQHMIHWYHDLNEEGWLNEGFSELAMFLNGYDSGGVDYVFTKDTDLQLNDWPTSDEESYAHYGASFLFLTYFLDRFGEGYTQAIVNNPINGLESIDDVLNNANITDPQTGSVLNADDVFADWVITNYLHNDEVDDGRYAYSNYPDAPQASVSETITTCPTDTFTRDVNQYGADYIRMTCPGDYALNFEGSIQVSLLPADPHSGNYAFWSNKGDSSDMTLTRLFDFRDHSGTLTMKYWTWYDIEKDFDYLYLLASTDGEAWEILTTPSGTAEDPTGSSYGWAYNGISTYHDQERAEWIQESVDISRFSGRQVYLRFEYITDAAVNGEGFMVDDISIPEIGYATDFENDDGGWLSDGFVRIQNRLPQTFRIALISKGDVINIDQYVLSDDNALSIPIRIGDDIDEVILAVSGTTRYTRQKAAYRFSIEQP
jgi:hypothetical protein